MAQNDYTEQYLKDLKYVARNVAASRRRETLSFSHHREVAALPAAEQTKWLDEAEAMALTREQLRVRIKAANAAASSQTSEFWVSVKCSSVEDRQELAERLRLEGRRVHLRTP